MLLPPIFLSWKFWGGREQRPISAMPETGLSAVRASQPGRTNRPAAVAGPLREDGVILKDSPAPGG